MYRNIVGYSVSSFGLGILASAILYPLGFLESKTVFNTMIIAGLVFVIIGSFIRPSKKEVPKWSSQKN
ncbi:hypothetical protein [Bacillus sp. 1P02SD]|uniref:hypothetical protein n=1 Tax=Bacillus sp. 1P02SD TaxID=3132264 RepID=UPI0039A23711